MGSWVTGRKLVQRIDTELRDLRAEVASASRSADEAHESVTRLREAQVDAVASLVALQLQALSTDDQDDVWGDATQRDVKRLLDDHIAFVEREAKELEDKASTIEALENKRDQAAEEHASLVQKYDALVDNVEAALEQDAAFQALRARYEDAAAVAARAEEKQALSEEDRAEKGRPYREDPLFSYLWERKFRSPAYRAMPLFRALDNWVAKLCRYDDAMLNYQRLIELPDRLAEHAEKQATQRDAALAALEEAEERALEAAGAAKLATDVEQKAAALDELDSKIEAAETAFRAASTNYDEALRGEAGPAVQARRQLEDRLQTASVPKLRVMAAETTTREDDVIVDQLVQLRADELLHDQDVRETQRSLQRTRDRLARLEAVRREIKDARLTSDYVRMREDRVADAIDAALHRQDDPASIVRKLARSARGKPGNYQGGFGGPRRRRTMGLPEILGEIAWEVARESMRHGSRGGTWGRSSGTRHRAPGRRSRPSGGFSTGGRIGGGGFKTGGRF